MRVLQIQGLRALAAIIVTLFHAQFVPGGFIGVDIFYVISGYLITGLILREIENKGRLDLASFYRRRIKRLLPASLFVLITTAIVGWLILPDITRGALGRDVLAAATYLSNYLFAWWENDYQNLNATPSPFIHYWSLAVEEQFYLFWPIFIIFLAKGGRARIRLGILVITLFSLSLSIYQVQSAPIWAFYSLPTRAWELGIGALLLFIPNNLLRNRALPWIGFVFLLFAAFNFNDGTAFPGLNAVLPVVATAILIASIGRWPPIFNDLSNNKISQWLGKISYPLYLWHWPALVLPSSALGRPLSIIERCGAIALTVVLAHLTNRYVEDPLREIHINPKKLYTYAAGATGASLALGLVIVFTSSTIITTRGPNPYSFDLNQVVAKPTVYGDDCQVNYGEVESGVCTYGDTQSKTTIVLYGDSHAAQWFPALEQLARDRGFKLISLTKSACPAVHAPRPDQGAFKERHCKKWRENSIARIKEIKPLGVITSSFAYFTPRANYPDRVQWWRDGQRQLLKNLQGSSEYIIYMSDTPRPSLDIPSCLATQLEIECNNSRPTPAKVISGFQVINPSSWLCEANCPAIVNSTVAYRDSSHISVAMALQLAPQLERSLKAIGLFR
ncbi:MAG: acyltransferase [Candidatus Planktophila sp.]|nr:acyltransferase [Candidatus Planktophila sp.]